MYDVIIACESMAAELLASLPEFERGTKANALEALNASMGSALQNDDLLAWAKADDDFHRLLVASCGNGRIARIAETIMRALETLAGFELGQPQSKWLMMSGFS
jgi:DNA-binding GntR family transcriptional regulator